jgi:LysR family hydrogen peroxide-inducible transcriptional activator
MNIRDLKYVVAVAEERHFGRAADKCHVSQPALSGQIRKLEDSLGVALFERTNRTVRVTPVGERIVAQARRLITLSDEIVASAQAARDPLAGPFRLGMISTIGPYLSPLILSAIRREMPDLSLTLVEGLTIELERRVANGELDGAVLATVPVDPHLTDISLYDEPFWIALSHEHPLAGQETIGLAELAHEELLLLADGHCLRDQVLDACHAATGAAKANTRETSLETLLALVAAGDAASGSAGRTVRLVCRASFPRPELVARLASIIRVNLPEGTVDPMQSGL